MRRAIVYSCLIGQLVIFCLASNVFESITLFLLFGVLPWQSAPLSPQAMMVFYSAVISAILTACFRKQITEFFENRTTRRQAQA